MYVIIIAFECVRMLRLGSRSIVTVCIAVGSGHLVGIVGIVVEEVVGSPVVRLYVLVGGGRTVLLMTVVYSPT